METSLKTGFAQIFSCCPKKLSCPKFVGGGGGGGGGGRPPPSPPPGPYAYEKSGSYYRPIFSLIF